VGLLAAFLIAPSCLFSQAFEKISNGVLVHASAGITDRVEVCSDTIVHIVSNQDGSPVKELVPTVVRPCSGARFTTDADARAVRLHTPALVIQIARDSGSIQFRTPAGQPVLSEQGGAGKTLPSCQNASAEQGVGQEFLLSTG